MRFYDGLISNLSWNKTPPLQQKISFTSIEKKILLRFHQRGNDVRFEKCIF